MKFFCSHCKELNDAPGEQGGQLIDCTHCGKTVEVPLEKKNISFISLPKQSHTKNWFKKYGVILVIAIGLFGIFFTLSRCDRKGESAEKELTGIPYELVKSWRMQGGQGKLILIDSSVATENNLERLIRHLSAEAKGDQSAIIQVFTSREAIEMRDNLPNLTEGIPSTETSIKFYDEHCVGGVYKSEGYSDKLYIMPQGLNGQTKYLNP